MELTVKLEELRVQWGRTWLVVGIVLCEPRPKSNPCEVDVAMGTQRDDRRTCVVARQQRAVVKGMVKIMVDA